MKHLLGVVVLHGSPPALFFTGRLLRSLPPARCLGCCSFPCWLWHSLTAGLEFLCLLLFWGPVQWSACWLPIKVNRTLETLFFCWLRSWWATGAVKCKRILLLALENNFSYFFPGNPALRDWGFFVRLSFKETSHPGSENLPTLWISSVESLLILSLLLSIRGSLTGGSQKW